MPAPAHLVRPWLYGLLAGLLAVAATIAPAQHERMVLGRAALALAAAESEPGPGACGMRAGHGERHAAGAPAEGGSDHLAAPSCFACLLMGAPGLPGVAVAVLAARARPAPAPALAPRPVRAAARAWAPHRPRGPPASLPA